MTAIIHTGSMSIDRLLGGGIRTGMVTDIFGQSGTGKSQLCFMLCASYAKYSKQKIQYCLLIRREHLGPKEFLKLQALRKAIICSIKSYLLELFLRPTR